MVSKSKYNLSATEMEIMEFYGVRKMKCHLRKSWFNDNKSKNWKKQTLNTFLVKLIEKGSLQYDMVKNKKYYYPTAQSQTKTEHIKYWTQNFINKTFDGSLSNFLCSFTGGARLDEKSYNELKKYLEDDLNKA